MKGFLDLQVPFFLPVWRRVAVIVLCALWGIVEISNGAIFWAVLFWGAGGLALWQFFFDGWPDDHGPKGQS
jgi:hypothetical protein